MSPQHSLRILVLAAFSVLLSVAFSAADVERVNDAVRRGRRPEVFVPAPPPGRRPDVIFVPVPQELAEKMLELAKVKPDDVVYDLGCGDGRIVVTAAKKYKAAALGIDIDPDRVKESLANVKRNHVEDLVAIKHGDFFALDLSGADVVTLYLLPSLNVKLIPQLEMLKPGSRIVSHDFDMKGVTPDKVIQVTPAGGRTHTIYLWTTPLKKGK